MLNRKLMTAMAAVTLGLMTAGGASAQDTVKIGLIVLLLWLVLAMYENVVAPALIGSFVITVLIFTMAFFVREYD